MQTNKTFGDVIVALKQGRVAFRQHNWDCCFIFRQVPSVVPGAIIPKMTSLPATVKEYLNGNEKLVYSDQIAKVTDGTYVVGYSPSVEDCFAEDWCIDDEEPITAVETVGTAIPIQK